MSVLSLRNVHVEKTDFMMLETMRFCWRQKGKIIISELPQRCCEGLNTHAILWTNPYTPK